MVWFSIMPSLMNLDQSMQPPNLHQGDRQDILAYFQRAWQLEDCLLKSIIQPETFYENPDPLRNLLIFYLGHSAVFYINKLVRVGLVQNRINPHFEQLFEIGVDPETADDIANRLESLRKVAVSAVWQYRTDVYHLIQNLIQAVTITYPIEQEQPLWALIMAIEHQYIHLETSSMLLRQLPTETLQRPETWQYAPANLYTQFNEMLEVKGGQVKLGKPRNSNTYGWDIEYGDRLILVDNFLASKYLITNAEFLDFVKAEGYENSNYWDEAAWTWKTQNNVQHPKFWIPQTGDIYDFKYRAMFDEIAMPFDYPVEVNYYEAIAYCRWLGNGTRLMTEAEWQLAAYAPEETVKDFDLSHYNLNFQWGSPCPVGSLGGAESHTGLFDLRGNVWEWLSDHLSPLDGYQPHDLYADYSAPYFDTKHHMMLGGSWITCGTAAYKYYRNWFRPNFHQHAGFRIAKTITNT